jgi:hypothetical protein
MLYFLSYGRSELAGAGKVVLFYLSCAVIGRPNAVPLEQGLRPPA